MTPPKGWMGAALAVALSSAAIAGDLVDHNGFEACWSQAITDSQFFGLMQSSIEGQTLCVAQSSGSCGPGCTYHACDTPACPGGATGCPVTLHSDAFGGDLAGGIYGADGSADDIGVHLSYSVNTFPATCTITATGIVLSYALGYTLQNDGNNGLYSASLNQTLLSVKNYSASADSANCSAFVSAFGPSFVQQVQAAGSTYIATLEAPTTVGESVCPLTP